MIKDLSPREYNAILRSDLGYFAERCFGELNPQAAFLPNWHIEVIAAKLAAVAQGKIQRLIINLPPRHLKSLIASIAFPAWCLGHNPPVRQLCSASRRQARPRLPRHHDGHMVQENLSNPSRYSPPSRARVVWVP